MPVKKQAQTKVTKEESKAATELQAPVRNENNGQKNNLWKSAKKLSESGVKVDDGEGLDFFHPPDYFSQDCFETDEESGESRLIDGSMSNPFLIANVSQRKGKYGLMIILLTVEKDENGEDIKARVGLSLTNKDGEYIEERVKLLNHFKNNTFPLGPVCFVALPSDYGKHFMQVQDFDEEIPF
jgi:hypothetical protein